MTAYLFAYGTLLPGSVPAEIAPVVEKLRVVGEGYVRGRLYDLVEYPGIVLDEAGDERVFGTAFELPDEPHILRSLDAYEGFDISAPDESLFLRVLCPVMLETGIIVEAWVYEYNRTPKPERLLPGGVFQRSRR